MDVQLNNVLDGSLHLGLVKDAHHFHYDKELTCKRCGKTLFSVEHLTFDLQGIRHIYFFITWRIFRDNFRRVKYSILELRYGVREYGAGYFLTWLGL